MREIKFRGKRSNGELVYGDLHHEFMTGNLYINGFKVIQETAGQYIGRKDVNGKEICEGDITSKSFMDDDAIIGVIEYHAPSFCKVVSTSNGKFRYPISEREEIIGIIYENPDLVPNS